MRRADDPLVPMGTDNFDRRMALDVIEDAFSAMCTAESRGLAVGLCSAFYMCGLLSRVEWEAFLERIPEDTGQPA